MKITIAATLLASASAFTVNQPKVDFGKVSWKDSVENGENSMMADRAEHATSHGLREPCGYVRLSSRLRDWSLCRMT